ncbi:glucose-induced degradation protein 8 homolog isoform X2 [Scaptodrosophila lebanonensis]|uniref:Glucose-induced degradation protein 8 homolog isoform X2 n=1 Tax=Drosophila lebanonensis TaxID=7225 RepID=A0A6J2TT77_DROLE|nr:glucose-induced degradation protein 8 homolog isoform X2 [Scaptodrosophila lebanonensis]
MGTQKNNTSDLPPWAHRMKSYQCKQADMNRLVMNYLVTEGYKDAAEKFETEADLEPGVKFENLEDRLRIRRAVTEGRVQHAMELAKKLYPRIFESDNYMYFHMQQLRLIELIRERKLEQALSFAQSGSSGMNDLKRENVHEMERTLALLAFEKPEESPFGDLMGHSYRQRIASEMNSAILKYEQAEDAEPKLMFLIKLILWAQGKLDNRCIDYQKFDLESDDFEEEFRRILESN